MVFEFDYVPLAIGRINQYAPDAVVQAIGEPSVPETPPVGISAHDIVSRLDLDSAIPVWNHDAITLRNEHESPLLRLPAELKLKIWSMAYEDIAIHVTCKEDGRVGHFICTEDRNNFYNEDSASSVEDALYLQCRCKGSLLEPPYSDAPVADDIKRRRECLPADSAVSRIGGMLLACREIYANARDYLWTQPTFIFPTQRLLPRFAASVPPELFSRISKVTLHTWSESWRHTSSSGFFGGSSDHQAPLEWADARSIISNMPRLKLLHLIVHVSGGDSTIWYEDCKPVGCVKSMTDELLKCGRTILPRKGGDQISLEERDTGVQVLLEHMELEGHADIESATILEGQAEIVDSLLHEQSPSPCVDASNSLRCMITAAIEGSRHGPGVTGSWVTREQVRGTALGRRAMLPERNMQMLRELEMELSAEWALSWWVSVEERDKGATGAGPAPWPFNHLPV